MLRFHPRALIAHGPLLSLALCIVSLAACAADASISQGDVPNTVLSFRKNQKERRSITLRELAGHAAARVVASDDAFYKGRRRFRAIPLEPALAYAFGESVATLRRASFLLRASDGYAVPIEGARLLEGGAFLAFDDVDAPGFLPIGPQHVSPLPAYLVWTRKGQEDPAVYPRPWQLVAIELAPIETLYPHAVPEGEAPNGLAMQGYAVFLAHCIKCHAINREGGQVGPDLNVPQSIVDYRPALQIRQYIRNPGSFRYSLMPAHPDLSETDLDGLIAYFHAMSRRKYDPTPTSH